jgi:hypothetical protein
MHTPSASNTNPQKFQYSCARKSLQEAEMVVGLYGELYREKMTECSQETAHMMRLKQISLLGERITRRDEHPFNIPAIATLDAVDVTSPVCFFVGENGTG